MPDGRHAARAASPRRAARLALLLAACGACVGPEPSPAADPTSRRLTEEGDVVGFAYEDAHVWRGLRFARAPVGALRWAPPRPPEPFQGLRQATSHPPQCPQLDRDNRPTGDEDCLYLNVYAPRFPSESIPTGDSRLPVMLFIHGGGNTIGSAKPFSGTRLARENRVIVVAIQYRLGVLGWFSHPALRATADSPAERSGNWATLDMIRALEWVRDNIAAFGGDPDRVTIFGESAGAIDVMSLLLSPAARGLFHRAVSQSGFPTSFTLAQAEHRTDDPEPGEPASSAEVLLSLLQRNGSAEDREAAKRTADAMGPEEVAAYLRGKPADEILGIFGASGAGAAGGLYVAPFVLRDGHVIPEGEPLEHFRRGSYNHVPTVLGTNRDEHKLFLAFLSPHVRRVFGVPIGFRDLRRYNLVSEYGARLWKAAGADEPAAAMRANQGPTVWGYRFDWDELATPLWFDLPNLIGAGHAVELLFVFGGTHTSFARYVVEHDEAAETLSREMRSYWSQLAAAGDPGRGQQGDLRHWKPWSPQPDGPKFMVFDSAADGGLRMSTDALTRDGVLAEVAVDDRLRSTEERCEVYRTFVQWSDAVTPEQYEQLENGDCRDHPLESRTVFD